VDNIQNCEIIAPTLERLPGYKGALERGWSPDDEEFLFRIDL
jgi:hypothetical protein